MLKRLKFICILSIIFEFSLSAQFSFDSISNSSEVLKKIFDNPSKYHLQIIYTQVSYKKNEPVFTTYTLNTNPKNYFYCASLVKLPTSILALQKLNEIKVKQNSIFFTDSSCYCHKKNIYDISSENGYSSIEHYIKKMFLVSDNFAYSRVLEFVSPDYLHKKLKAYGYKNVRIINRYDGNCNEKNQLISNPISFLDSNLNVIYSQKEHVSKYTPLPSSINVKVGKSYYNNKNKLVKSSKSFEKSNYLNLLDCHSILLNLIYKNKFKISETQRDFLIKYLTIYPRQSIFPKYDSIKYPDNYKKYSIFGDSQRYITDSTIKITNIVGLSYGFMIDCARIYDKKNNIEFMLSAVIYANEDGVLNDGKYDYYNVGMPFLAELGRQFYNYELKRK